MDIMAPVMQYATLPVEMDYVNRQQEKTVTTAHRIAATVPPFVLCAETSNVLDHQQKLAHRVSRIVVLVRLWSVWAAVVPMEPATLRQEFVSVLVT